MQDLKRSHEGQKFFDEHDSYNFFKLAIREHQYLSPAISSAAVARAKDDFEGLRQRAEDSITEHVNEFGRRLEVFKKARGEGNPMPYADFDLRDLLQRSLYAPTWSAWIANREDNDNLPATFEDLILALKKAEAKKILKSPSPLDAYMPSAHATSQEKMEMATPGGPTPCQVCGEIFCPKKSTHIRCDTCQSKFVKQRKLERKKNKKTGNKRKEKPQSAKGKKRKGKESSRNHW